MSPLKLVSDNNIIDVQPLIKAEKIKAKLKTLCKERSGNFYNLKNSITY